MYTYITYIFVLNFPLSFRFSKEDYTFLVKALDNIINIVGEDEDHFLSELMHLIGSIIDDYQRGV